MQRFPEINFALPGKEAARTDFGVMARDEWGVYALVKGVGPVDCSAAPYEQALSAFNQLDVALSEFGMGFRDVVRTWIYADGILGWYADLNRARDDFFRSQGVGTNGGFVPASTGIGWSSGGAKIVLGAFAVRAERGGIEVEQLPSPLQCPALEYGSQFSRAVEIRTPGWRRIVVSGTASILPGSQEVAHVGDVDAQVDCTMRAVEAIYVSRGMGFEDVTGALVYLKREEYRSAWERWLAHHPEFPCANVRAMVADVCRPEWLFEIESDATK